MAMYGFANCRVDSSVASRLQPTRWDLFRILCKVVGGQDTRALSNVFATGQFSQLVELGQRHDITPALAVRCNEQLTDQLPAVNAESELLRRALRDNTLRNMQISAQALKFTTQLNKASITPLFLKGTVQLLTADTENLGFRQQADIDVLVEPAQLEAAGEVFLSSGYAFCEFSNSSTTTPTLIHDTATAIKRSASHHHLLPLVKNGYAATVELHRHFLPKRFQGKNQLEPLFNTAHKQERHGAKFLVPSTEYQLIHLILGKLVNDSYLARRTMPLREACDYIALIEGAHGEIDCSLIQKHCGKNFSLFVALVAEFMAYTPGTVDNGQGYRNVGKRIRTMQKRYNSPTLGLLLDAYARTVYLGHELAYNPQKLPAYLGRLNSN